MHSAYMAWYSQARSQKYQLDLGSHSFITVLCESVSFKLLSCCTTIVPLKGELLILGACEGRGLKKEVKRGRTPWSLPW